MREIGGIDEEESGSRADENGDQDEQGEEHAADEAASTDFYRWEIFVERLHGDKVRIAFWEKRISGENHESMSCEVQGHGSRCYKKVRAP